MNLRKLLILTIALLGTSGAGVALAHGNAKSAMKAVPHTAITFVDGSAMLTDSDKDSLRKLVQDARAKRTIDQVTVAAWSDNALPRQGQKLSDADRELAMNRADAIKDYLKTATEVSNVDTYNMAESSNWMARTFNTKDAELKSVFGKTGAEIPVTRDEFQVIRKEGGLSKAVVTVAFKAPEKAAPMPNF